MCVQRSGCLQICVADAGSSKKLSSILSKLLLFSRILLELLLSGSRMLNMDMVRED
jgi:hypothetical protein